MVHLNLMKSKDLLLKLFLRRVTILIAFAMGMPPSILNAQTFDGSGFVYAKTFNKYMGTASTGEAVTLINVRTILRGGSLTRVKYQIGANIIESSVDCRDRYNPYFRNRQTIRYPQSKATSEILRIACSHEEDINRSPSKPGSFP